MIKTPWRALRRRLLRWREARGDRRLGVRTVPDVAEVHFDPSAEQSPYEPVQYAALDEIDGRVKVGPGDVIYDLGCGSGRIICHYAAKDVGRVIGVEYDQGLARAAQANADRMRGRRAPVTVIAHDAATVSYEGATLVFLYNPFGAETLRKVLARLPATTGLRIVYANPLHASVFREFPRLVEDARFFVPYDLGRMAVTVWRQD